jgi:HEPN domain-containing protein
MHTGSELRKMTHHKLRTVKRLLDAGEWEVAAYLMGYALECALKASASKRLNLTTYPPLRDSARNKVAEGFKTHDFKQLLVVSGLSDLFRVGSTYYTASQNWSDFTIEYPDNWTTMRYTDGSVKKFDEPKVKDLYKCLYDDSDSIIQTIIRKKRW